MGEAMDVKLVELVGVEVNDPSHHMAEGDLLLELLLGPHLVHGPTRVLLLALPLFSGPAPR
jgi:hypothetical protein